MGVWLERIGYGILVATFGCAWYLFSWQFALSLIGAIITWFFSIMVIAKIILTIQNEPGTTYWVPEFCCFVFQVLADVTMVATQSILTFYGKDEDHKKVVVVNGIAVNASLIALILFIIIQLFRKGGCGPHNWCKMVNNKWYHCVIYTVIYSIVNVPFAIFIVNKEWDSADTKFQLIWFAYTCLVMGIFLFFYYLLIPILTTSENRRSRMNANWICFFVVVTSSILFRALGEMLVNFWLNMILQTIGYFNYLCYVNWLKTNTSSFAQPDQQGGGVQMGAANNHYRIVP